MTSCNSWCHGGEAKLWPKKEGATQTRILNIQTRWVRESSRTGVEPFKAFLFLFLFLFSSGFLPDTKMGRKTFFVLFKLIDFFGGEKSVRYGSDRVTNTRRHTEIYFNAEQQQKKKKRSEGGTLCSEIFFYFQSPSSSCLQRTRCDPGDLLLFFLSFPTDASHLAPYSTPFSQGRYKTHASF